MSSHLRTQEPQSHASSGEELELTPDALFTQEYVRLCRTAFVLLRDHHRAEEVVQDAFAALLARWDRVDPQKAASYLYRCVVNAGRSALRRHRAFGSLRWNRPEEQPGPEDSVLTSALDRELWKAVNRLPSRQRQVLVLRYYSELTVAQVSEVLSISPAAVATATNHAINALRANKKEWSQ